MQPLTSQVELAIQSRPGKKTDISFFRVRPAQSEIRLRFSSTAGPQGNCRLVLSKEKKPTTFRVRRSGAGSGGVESLAGEGLGERLRRPCSASAGPSPFQRPHRHQPACFPTEKKTASPQYHRHLMCSHVTLLCNSDKYQKSSIPAARYLPDLQVSLMVEYKKSSTPLTPDFICRSTRIRRRFMSPHRV